MGLMAWRPPLRTDGAKRPPFRECARTQGRPHKFANGSSSISEKIQPALASMANRECLISASRKYAKRPGDFAKFKGSKPASPTMEPSSNGGASSQGNASDRRPLRKLTLLSGIIVVVNDRADTQHRADATTLIFFLLFTWSLLSLWSWWSFLLLLACDEHERE